MKIQLFVRVWLMHLHTHVSCCASLLVHVSLYVSCIVLLCVSRCTRIAVSFLLKLRWLAVKGLGMCFGRSCHDDTAKPSSIGAASDKSAASAFGVASSTGATGLDIAPAAAAEATGLAIPTRAFAPAAAAAAAEGTGLAKV